MNQDKPEDIQKRETLDIEVPKDVTKKFGATKVVLVNEPEKSPDGVTPGFSELFVRLYKDKISEKLLGPNPFDTTSLDRVDSNKKPG